MTSSRPKRVTIVDVARHAGVSHSTVSRVLNDNAAISEPTRERVLESCAALGYVANAAARALAGGRSGAIGAVVRNPFAPRTAQILSGVSRRLSAAGHDLLMCDVEGRTGSNLSHVQRILSNGGVDGLMVVGDATDGVDLAMLDVAERPVVLVDQVGDGPAETGAHQVTRAAIEHLAAQGHQRMMLLAGTGDSAYERARVQAFLSLVAEGVGLVSAGIQHVEPDDDRIDAATQLLSADAQTTAVITADPVLGAAVLAAAQGLGRSVPDGLSVLADDTLGLSGWASSPLTMVVRDLKGAGYAAAERMLRRLGQAGDADEVPPEVSVTVVTGSSTTARTASLV